MTDEDLYTKLSTEIVTDLKKSFDSKKLVATGETKNSIRFEVSPFGFRILGAGHLSAVEHGRGPAKSGAKKDPTFLKRLERWIAARGLNIKPDTLRYFINKNGTKQWQSGKSNKVISSVVNDDLILTTSQTIATQKQNEYKKTIIEQTLKLL